MSTAAFAEYLHVLFMSSALQNTVRNGSYVIQTQIEGHREVHIMDYDVLHVVSGWIGNFEKCVYVNNYFAPYWFFFVYKNTAPWQPSWNLRGVRILLLMDIKKDLCPSTAPFSSQHTPLEISRHGYKCDSIFYLPTPRIDSFHFNIYEHDWSCCMRMFVDFILAKAALLIGIYFWRVY